MLLWMVINDSFSYLLLVLTINEIFSFLVSNKLSTLKKDFSIIKLDVIKNQELLTDLTMNTRSTPSMDTRQVINRGSLKIPVDTLEELNVIERDDEKIGTLVFYLISLFY